MKPIELLAPARDLECGIAAINCGADAVYVGAPRFGARESAGNSLADIETLVGHAHKYWAKVYVTLNTLLQDDEIPQALQLVSQLHEAGIDGLIIQDLGLLECALPPLLLIASTQMHNHTPERVAFLEKVGFQRVILARELSLEQVQQIRKATTIDLEFFVHGALCVSYSGQCYMSYAIGGRSGNRGQCAQPCRRNYSLVDRQGRSLVDKRYLLSLKDLNLSEHLTDLIQAGISSFKIEGRLKDRAYVTNVVSYYRQRLDQVLAATGLKKSSSGRSLAGFTPRLEKTFNRGFTTYFLKGRDETMACLDTPKMIGEELGVVISTSQSGFKLKSSVSLHNGDGICFFGQQRELRGTVINQVRGENVYPDKMDEIVKGLVIYRNHDHHFLAELKRCRSERSIGLALELTEVEGGFKLSALDEDGIQAECVKQSAKHAAQNSGMALAMIEKHLRKLGGTEFKCTSLGIRLSKTCFIPVRELNAWRREVLDQLSAARARNRPVSGGTVERNPVPFPQESLTYEGNVLNEQAARFYRRHGVREIAPAAESGMDMSGKRVMTTRYCLARQLGWCGPGATPHGMAEPLYLEDEDGRRYRLELNCERCEMEIYY